MSKLKASPFEIEQFLLSHGLEIRRKGRKAEIKICPFCQGGEHNDLWKCVVYLDETGGNFKCVRGSCGATGSFWQLVEHFGGDPKKFYEHDNWTPRPTSKLPDSMIGQFAAPPQSVCTNFTPAPETFTDHPLTQQAEEYLQRRGFSPELFNDLPVWCDSRGNICFGYYYLGELCMTKCRVPRKRNEGEQKAWQAWKGGLRPLWLIERCDPTHPRLVIVEGEYDALALRQAGVQNVVSVPNGTNDFEWINICWDDLISYDEIVIWPDNDAAGHEAMLRMAERLGYEKLRVVRSPYKDANEHLIFRMQEVADEADIEIRELVENAEWLQKGDLERLSEVLQEQQCYEGYTSGIESLDKVLGAFFFGQLVLHIGPTKNGKSSGVNQITAMAAEQGGKICVWPGEDTKSSYKNKMYLHIAGWEGSEGATVERTGTKYRAVRPDVAAKIDQFLYDKLFIFKPRQLMTVDLLLHNFELAFRRYGCNVFVVDNLMKLVAGQDSENVWQRQAQIVDKLVTFAQTHRVTVHLVCHTNKSGSEFEPPTLKSNAGAAEVTNLCDRALFWWKVPDGLRSKYQECEAVVGILAERVWGHSGKFPVRYSPEIKRFACSRGEIERKYSLPGVYDA